MQLKNLSVIHLSGSQELDSASDFRELKGVFYLETCQRRVWVATHPSLLRGLYPNAKLYQGREAYLFLLRLAAGLESKILGETDIFGQFKAAWKKTMSSQNSHLFELNSCFQKIFEDTKEIRTTYVQNLGGSSYGTLVRRVLKDDESSDPRPTLIVGAGQIAQSVAPFLSESELWLWNRSPQNLEPLLKKLSSSPMPRVQILRSDQESEAWQKAKSVVVCIPMNTEEDRIRLEWFKKGGETRSLVHLGGMRSCSPHWQALPRFFALDDLFALQNSQTDIRASRLLQAEKACEARATLRGLGMSLSTSHCWEDLSCFA